MAHLTDAAQDKQRLQMIRQVFKDKAPLTFKALQTTGKLLEFLKERDKEMLESYQNIVIQMRQQLPEQKTYLENLQELTAIKARAWEETLETNVEFSDPEQEQTTSSNQAP
jgi:hypothetical protein